MKTLLERLTRDYERANKKDKVAIGAKIDKFSSLVAALGFRRDSDKDDMAERISYDTGYDHAKALIKSDGAVVNVNEVKDDPISGIEIIDCSTDEQPSVDTLEGFLDRLYHVGSTNDLIDLEAKYSKYTSYPEVVEFMNWAWGELEHCSE